jgi:polysaccharide export outer membrane protein
MNLTIIFVYILAIMFRLSRELAVLPLVILFAVSCGAPKRTIYFKEGVKNNDTTVSTQEIPPVPESKIQPDDILAINITSISSLSEQNSDPVGIFNSGGTTYPITPMAGGGMGGGMAQTNGYLVDKDGFIDFPVLGKLKVGGATVRELKNSLADQLKAYVKEPVVDVRVINYRVILLGEVGRTGPVIAPNSRMNIIEAISAAGDIPITGRKDNILIVRENEGKREFARINLNSKDVFKDPYFDLRQNDIIYVEPSRLRRQETNEFLRFYLPTIASLLSTALAVYGIVQLTK